MSRVKKGVAAHKHRKYLLDRAKGFINGANSKFRLAKERLLKAESNAYRSRKLRKRDFRSLWITSIHKLNTSDIKLNRKAVSEMAIKDIEAFKDLLNKITA
jgi:large subunit ribosomal protein L20